MATREKTDETITHAPAALTPAASATDAEAKTVEEWATAKGMLPEIFPGGTLHADVPRGTFARVNLSRGGAVGPRHNPKHGAFKAAKVRSHWPEGLAMTEKKFDEAIKAVDDVTQR